MKTVIFQYCNSLSKSMRVCLPGLFLLLGIISKSAFAQSAEQTIAIKKQLQLKLDSLQKINGFPGVTFAAILPNGEKIVLASGLADSATATPMHRRNRMLSGSNGKTIFVASALVLAEQGLFNLDDKIEAYIGGEPWFNRIPNARSITIRMLMNHTSGIEEYYMLGDFMQKLKNDPDRSWAPLEAFSYVFDREPLFEAGTSWGYADTNYLILGYILEKISGRKMYALAEEYVLGPYNLTQTEPSLRQTFECLAVGYSGRHSPFPFHGAMVKKGSLVFNPQFEWTGGGFVSSAEDLAAWAKGMYYFEALSPAIREEVRKGVKASTGKDHLYGLGIQIRPGGDAGYGYGHSGWFPGYTSDAEYFPDINIAMGIQFNTDDMSFIKKSPHAYLLELAGIITSF